jgi:hypothetical protein
MPYSRANEIWGWGRPRSFKTVLLSDLVSVSWRETAFTLFDWVWWKDMHTKFDHKFHGSHPAALPRVRISQSPQSVASGPPQM